MNAQKAGSGLRAFQIAFNGEGLLEFCLLAELPSEIEHTASFVIQSYLMKARLWREFKTMACQARDLERIR